MRSLHACRAVAILAPDRRPSYALSRLQYRRLIQRLSGLVLRHPGLMFPLLGAAWRFRARHWYRQPPFLPLPPRDYIAWRLHTAYGDEDAVPPARDLLRYLEWSARLRNGGTHDTH